MEAFEGFNSLVVTADLSELLPVLGRLNEQAGAIMTQLHVIADLIQCIGGALFGALAANAVTRGFKL